MKYDDRSTPVSVTLLMPNGFQCGIAGLQNRVVRSLLQTSTDSSVNKVPKGERSISEQRSSDCAPIVQNFRHKVHSLISSPGVFPSRPISLVSLNSQVSNWR